MMDAKEDIDSAFANPDDCDSTGFQPKCLFIVTFQRQESYCDYVDCCHVDEGGAVPNPKPWNYYQLVWATDDFDSYAILNYQKIDWLDCWDYSRVRYAVLNWSNISCIVRSYNIT